MSQIRRISRNKLRAFGPDYTVIGNASAYRLKVDRVTLLGCEFSEGDIVEIMDKEGHVRWFLVTEPASHFHFQHDHLFADYFGNPASFGDGTFAEVELVN